MGYTGEYTLFERCISEFVATWMFIFLLLAVIANKLLPKTKGHNIDFGWIAFGIGLAVFLPVQFFGYISSQLNPAMSLANAIAGAIDWRDLVPLSIAQFLGAFLGAITLWIYYLPHFATVPEPPPKKDTDRLLRTRDDVGPDSLAFASYNTENPKVKHLSQGIRQFKGYLYGRVYKDEDILGHNAVLGRRGMSRRRSVDPSDLHGRLERMHTRNIFSRARPKRKVAGKSIKENKNHNRNQKAESSASQPISFALSLPEASPSKSVHWPDSIDGSDKEDASVPLLSKHQQSSNGGEIRLTINTELSPDTLLRRNNVSELSLMAIQEHNTKNHQFYEPCRAASSCEENNPIEDIRLASAPADDSRVIFFQSGSSLKRNSMGNKLLGTPKSGNISQRNFPRIGSVKETKAEKLKDASILADQHIKLAIFATRPAIFAPISNLFAEMMGTMLLSSGILFLNQRGGMIWEGDKEVYMHGLKAFWVGILINSLVLSLGGIGVAINPARDFAPRLAHWLLPIAGKGDSEWYYSWIPLLGTFMGGALGGLFYNLCDKLNHSNVYEGYYSQSLSQLLQETTEL